MKWNYLPTIYSGILIAPVSGVAWKMTAGKNTGDVCTMEKREVRKFRKFK